MATKASIVIAIQIKAASIPYNSWRIGLTHDLAERRKFWEETERQNISAWSDWKADSLKDAQEIEAHFIKKGMKGGTGGALVFYKPVHVYVF
jgi:hypothetical protein